MNSHKTAISRSKPSKPVRELFASDMLHNWFSGRILDFGCGKGKDVEYLSSLAFDAVGYDVHFQPRKPKGKFHLVLMNYVVNVLQPAERDAAIQHAWSYVEKGGRLIVTSRTEREIKQEALKGNWQPIGRGYCTNAGTFQRGYTQDSLQRVLRSRLDRIKNTQASPTNTGGVTVIILKD